MKLMNSKKSKKNEILEIVAEGHPALRKENRTVDRKDFVKTLSLAEKMIRTCKRAQGVGLAAPQIGINIKLCVVELNDKFEVMINPEIIYESEEKQIGREGCLSIANCYGEVERPSEITVRYSNGIVSLEKSFKDFEARKVLHEVDHLNGILYIDKAINVKKEEII